MAKPADSASDARMPSAVRSGMPRFPGALPIPAIEDSNAPAAGWPANRRYSIAIEGYPGEFDCPENEPALRAMERLGRRQVQVGCRGGGCGVCKVLVLAGDYRTGKMSRQQVSEDEERLGYALACRLFPKSNLVLRAVGKGDSKVTQPPTGKANKI